MCKKTFCIIIYVISVMVNASTPDELVAAARDYFLIKKDFNIGAQTLAGLLEKEEVLLKDKKTTSYEAAKSLVNQLSSDALEAWRLQVESKAKELLEQGLLTLTPQLFEKTYRKYPGTESAEKALEMLATYHLDRGSYYQAAMLFDELLLSKKSTTNRKLLFKAAIAYARYGDSEKKQVLLSKLGTEPLNLGKKTLTHDEIKNEINRDNTETKKLNLADIFYWLKALTSENDAFAKDRAEQKLIQLGIEKLRTLKNYLDSVKTSSKELNQLVAKFPLHKQKFETKCYDGFDSKVLYPSYDGSKFVTIEQDDKLKPTYLVADTRTGKIIKKTSALEEHYGASFSPDLTKVFSRDGNGNPILLDFNGNTLEKFENDKKRDKDAKSVFSEDGKHVLYLSQGNQLALINLDTKKTIIPFDEDKNLFTELFGFVRGTEGKWIYQYRNNLTTTFFDLEKKKKLPLKVIGRKLNEENINAKHFLSPWWVVLDEVSVYRQQFGTLSDNSSDVTAFEIAMPANNSVVTSLTINEDILLVIHAPYEAPAKLRFYDMKNKSWVNEMSLKTHPLKIVTSASGEVFFVLYDKSFCAFYPVSNGSLPEFHIPKIADINFPEHKRNQTH